MRAVVPTMREQDSCLLAVTPTRVLLAQRGRLRTKVDQWRRRDLASIRFESMRYGVLLLGLRNGQRLRFEFVSRDDARQVEQAVLPPRRHVDPVKAAMPPVAFQARKAGASGPRPPVASGAGAPPAPDPLAHRGTQQHEVRLRQMHAKGVLTKAELEWQLAT